jgi:ABC-type protease/lipase transport system fused ATPase/permease subunit
VTGTVIALGIILALGLMIWGAINTVRRNSVAKNAKTARIKDLEHAEQIHNAAADARAVQPDTPVDQRLRDIGRLRRD